MNLGCLSFYRRGQRQISLYVCSCEILKTIVQQSDMTDFTEIIILSDPSPFPCLSQIDDKQRQTNFRWHDRQQYERKCKNN